MVTVSIVTVFMVIYSDGVHGVVHRTVCMVTVSILPMSKLTISILNSIYSISILNSMVKSINQLIYIDTHGRCLW